MRHGEEASNAQKTKREFEGGDGHWRCRTVRRRKKQPGRDVPAQKKQKGEADSAAQKEQNGQQEEEDEADSAAHTEQKGQQEAEDEADSAAQTEQKGQREQEESESDGDDEACWICEEKLDASKDWLI